MSASTVRRLRVQLATVGLRGMASLMLRHRLRRPLAAFGPCRELLAGARGLEIGGPSAIFARDGILPVYPLLASLDGCDYADRTLWHGEGAEGAAYVYDPERPPGRRLVRDATALEGIADGAYDAVLSSHTLEHVANPLLALREWKRVVRPDGALLLVVPHVQNTVDHRRPVTTLDHLVADEASGTPETDTTHLDDFVELADLSRAPEVENRDEFVRRTLDNAVHRAAHHHVFDTELVALSLDRAGWELVALEPALPFHVVALARASAGVPDNAPFLTASASWRETSVFARDRRSAQAQSRRA